MTILDGCPFCGKLPIMEQIGRSQLRIRCECGIQRTQGVIRESLDWLREKMIEKWNTRQ